MIHRLKTFFLNIGVRKISISNFLIFRVMLPMLLSIIIPVSMMTYFMNQLLVHERLGHIFETSEVISHNIESQQQKIHSAFIGLMNILEVGHSESEKDQIIEAFIEQQSDVVLIYKIDSEGVIRNTYPETPLLEGTFLGDMNTYKEVSHQLMQSKAMIFEKADTPVIIIRTMMDQQPYALAYRIDFSMITEHLKNNGIDLIINDGASELIKSSNQPGEANLLDTGKNLRISINGEEKLFKTGTNLGKSYVFFEKALEEYGWTLITRAPSAILYETSTWLIILFISLILVSLGLFYLVRQRVLKQAVIPLATLSEYVVRYDRAPFLPTTSNLIEIEQLNLGVIDLNYKLDTIQKELNEFVFAASHDLQEPLRTISSYLEILKSDFCNEQDEDAKKYLSYILEASSRLQKMISALLCYSRLNQYSIFEKISLDYCLKNALDNLQLQIQSKTVQFDISPLPVVIGDINQLTMLLQNIISNSIKYSQNEVRIRITFEQGRLSIADNGIGFDLQYKKQIFMPFKRLHAVHEYQGSGIGLASVTKIVKAHSWEIDVESEIGVGTTFIIQMKAGDYFE